MRKKKEPPPQIPCPRSWTIGPFRQKDGTFAERVACPWCNKVGIRSGDGILAYHP